MNFTFPPSSMELPEGKWSMPIASNDKFAQPSIRDQLSHNAIVRGDGDGWCSGQTSV